VENAQPAGEVWNLRNAVIEVDQKGEVVLAPFISLPEPVCNRDAINRFASFAQVPHRAQNAPVSFERKIIVRELTNLVEMAVIEQHRREDKSLGVDVAR
jgi:hypothetical protein